MYQCGFTVPISCLSLEHIPAQVKSICIHVCIVPVKAELDHLCEGLNLFGIYDLIKRFPEPMEDLFVLNKSCVLTSTTIISLFDIEFSPEGFNTREAEEAAVFHWYEFLSEVLNG